MGYCLFFIYGTQHPCRIIPCYYPVAMWGSQSYLVGVGWVKDIGSQDSPFVVVLGEIGFCIGIGLSR